MKRILKIAAALLFALLLLGTFWFLWQKTRPVKIVYAVVQPKIDTIRQFVVATGKVEPRDEVLIKPQISGIVSEVRKEAGQTVRKGDIIALVKVIPEMGQLNSAESRVSVAAISLDQTRREHQRTAALHEKASFRRRSSSRASRRWPRPRRRCRTRATTSRSCRTASPAATRR